MSRDILRRYAEAFDAKDFDELVHVYEYAEVFPGLQTAINALRKSYNQPSERSMMAQLTRLRERENA